MSRPSSHRVTYFFFHSLFSDLLLRLYRYPCLIGMARPLPSSPFLILSCCSFFDEEGMNRLDLRRLFLEVVGVEVGVGSSLSLPPPPPPVPPPESLPEGGIRPRGCRPSPDTGWLGGTNFAILLFSLVSASKACWDVPCEMVPHFCEGCDSRCDRLKWPDSLANSSELTLIGM